MLRSPAVPWRENGLSSHNAELGTWDFTALALVSPPAKQEEPFQRFGLVVQDQKE